MAHAASHMTRFSQGWITGHRIESAKGQGCSTGDRPPGHSRVRRLNGGWPAARLSRSVDRPAGHPQASSAAAYASLAVTAETDCGAPRTDCGLGAPAMGAHVLPRFPHTSVALKRVPLVRDLEDHPFVLRDGICRGTEPSGPSRWAGRNPRQKPGNPDPQPRFRFHRSTQSATRCGPHQPCHSSPLVHARMSS